MTNEEMERLPIGAYVRMNGGRLKRAVRWMKSPRRIGNANMIVFRKVDEHGKPTGEERTFFCSEVSPG